MENKLYNKKTNQTKTNKQTNKKNPTAFQSKGMYLTMVHTAWGKKKKKKNLRKKIHKIQSVNTEARQFVLESIIVTTKMHASNK